ncbi:hypothetical protein ACJIZ3_018080 [Penstemon smallii]|uniref:Glycosyltransferase n=1 Tax=Penstemon smallii TaxID=265156 RepID=A0ABD3SYN2_9LAMI
MDYHILQVTFPAQGHINPSLQLAKRLTKMGVKVTFLTSLSAIRRMSKTNSSIDFVSFSDGYDNGWSNVNVQDFMSSLKEHGSKAVSEILTKNREKGQPFTRVIHSLLIPWAGQAAYDLQVPVTLVWIQPATLFDIYFYHFNKYIDNCNGGNRVIELPGLPKFEPNDLPSFLLDSNPNIYDFALQNFKEHFELLDRESRKTRPTVLVNTFDALEHEPLRVIDKYKLIPIGPLTPSGFLDGKDPSDNSFGGDLIKKSVDYVEWLDSKDKLSVVYIAFGSYSDISKSQLDEIAKGLIKSNRPFLWVIRGTENREKLDEMLSFREDLEKIGKIVPWCDQVEVLSHSSVGCFVTHCGWNSTLESLVFGVPVVAIPQWTDQATNAKLVQDYWRSGVRCVKGVNGGVVECGEFERCLEIVMGCGEMRKEAKKWKELAKETMKEDGNSNANLKFFIENVVGGHCQG